MTSEELTACPNCLKVLGCLCIDPKVMDFIIARFRSYYKCKTCRELLTNGNCKIHPKCEFSTEYRTPEEAGISEEEMYDPAWFPYYPPG